MAQAEQEVADHVEILLEQECRFEGAVDPKDIKGILMKRWCEDYIRGKYQKLDPLHGTSEYESRGTILDIKVKQDSIEIVTGWKNDPTGQSERGKVTEVIKLEKPKDNT